MATIGEVLSNGEVWSIWSALKGSTLLGTKLQPHTSCYHDNDLQTYVLTIEFVNSVIVMEIVEFTFSQIKVDCYITDTYHMNSSNTSITFA